jgi:hypothetical protein
MIWRDSGCWRLWLVGDRNVTLFNVTTSAYCGKHVLRAAARGVLARRNNKSHDVTTGIVSYFGMT